MHHVGKYSPTRCFTLDAPIAVLAIVNKSPILTVAKTVKGEDVVSVTTLEEMSTPQSAKMRLSKGAVVKAVRWHPSVQPTSPESLGMAWSARPDNVKQERSSGLAPARARNKPNPAEPSRRTFKDEISLNGRVGRKRRGFRPPDVRTIFSPGERDPRVKEEKGEGHSFVEGEAATWCDACCEYILLNCLTCTGCKYTCHAECQHRVVLDCQPGECTPADGPLSQDQLNNNTQLTNVEKERDQRTQFSKEEIRQKVEQYNALTKDHLKMTLSPSGVYTGFIKVQLELRRPVTVRGGRGLAAGAEAFYLPRGSTNTLHISSNNTVKQVIIALLNKFTVADNPAKYALFKRYSREEQVYVCKLAEGEQPLFLRLVAGPDTDTFGFVLREQQTGEVMWDAFSIPELHNFLRILDKEEQEQRDAITRRYDNYRLKLQEALRDTRGPL